MALDTTKHKLVPIHTKLSDTERQKLLDSLQVIPSQIPKIMKDDPAIVKLNTKSGDIIKIERKSSTAGVSLYYRVVIDG